VAYRSIRADPAPDAPAGGSRRGVPGCETSLVWPGASANPVLARFVAFISESPG
jgi:hypothetical protein